MGDLVGGDVVGYGKCPCSITWMSRQEGVERRKNGDGDDIRYRASEVACGYYIALVLDDGVHQSDCSCMWDCSCMCTSVIDFRTVIGATFLRAYYSIDYNQHVHASYCNQHTRMLVYVSFDDHCIAMLPVLKLGFRTIRQSRV